MYYTNCDVLTKAKVNDLQVYTNLFSPDIICLTEVLPKTKDFIYDENMYFLSGYVLVTSVLAARGICMFCKPELQVIILEKDIAFSEYIFCKIIFDDIVLYLGVIYRSPNSSGDNNVQLCDLLTYMSNVNCGNLVVVGDFNYNSINWEVKAVESTSVSEVMFLDRVQDLFLEQLILEPTRYRVGQRSNILDLVLTNNTYCISDIHYHDPLGASDHISLLLELNIYKVDQPTLPRKLYYKGDYVAMNNYFMDIDWNVLLANLSTQDSINLFYEHVDYAVNEFIPTGKAHSKDTVDKEWVNLEVKHASKVKRGKWDSVRKDKGRNPVLYEDWKRLRNISNSLANRRRISYESKIIMDSKINPKSFWAYVKKRTKKPGDVSSLLNVDGSITMDDQEKANILNTYFASVFVQEPDDNFFIENCDDRVDATLDFIYFVEADIVKVINKLNVSKASGPDNLHARVIKECCVIFASIFCVIFKKSLQEGSLPHQWKEANVKAIFKKGKRSICSNYRPVSLTSIICKIFESLIRDRLTVFLEHHSILSKHQHGFRSGHSCLTQLLEIMNDFSDYYEEDIPYDCIYLDFSKAFDRVPHNRLLTKVYNCGIRGEAFQWIKNFLFDRSQCVVVNGKLSSRSKVSSGIPQGSVLGPLLFTIFINDLPDNVISHIKIFADDTKIYNSIDNSLVLNSDLNTLVDWSDRWLLPFNIDKCKVLHYGKRNAETMYYMNGNVVSTDSFIKDLGVTFQSNFKFDNHISKICATANSRLGIIRSTFHCIDKEGFIVLYKCLVRPILEYCNLIWLPHLRKHQIMIEQIQRRATRMIQGMDTLTYSERLVALHLDTLYYRRRRADLIQVYRIVNKIDCIEMSDLFEYDTGITRGNSKKLFKPRSVTSIKQHSFSHRVINDWNDLPNNVVMSDSLNKFKSNLSIYWLEKEFRVHFLF